MNQTRPMDAFIDLIPLKTNNHPTNLKSIEFILDQLIKWTL
jgi:hypothetical protein